MPGIFPSAKARPVFLSLKSFHSNGERQAKKTEHTKEANYVCVWATRAMDETKKWTRVRVMVRGFGCSLHIDRVAGMDLTEKVRF